MIRQFFRSLRILLAFFLYLFRPEVVRYSGFIGVLVRLNPLRFFVRGLSRGQLLVRFLESLGPIFIKFGQVLSTRVDFIPKDILDELERLQDQVKPFDGQLSQNHLEKIYKKPLSEVFSSFDKQPLASASVAQVHAATLHSGESVIVKIIRPNIRRVIESDIALMYRFARIVNCFARAKRLRLPNVVDEFEQTILDELDLMREAANAQQLARNFSDSTIMRVPAIHWDYVDRSVLVQDRIFGVPINDMNSLNAAQVNMKVLAENGVDIFFTQVFKHSFFHADMHPGNLFVDISNPEKPVYVGVDFGIMGSMSDSDQRYIAENLLAFFNQDYKRVAVLHIESGWVPSDTRVDLFESAIRTVCEPIFDKPLKDISFGRVLLRLFQVAERFQMEVQPQLLLLQKTLFNIEGLGRRLYPELDLWHTAKPILERFVASQKGMSRVFKRWTGDFSAQAEKLLSMPEMLHDVLSAVELNQRQIMVEKKNHSRLQRRSFFKPILVFVVSLLLILFPFFRYVDWHHAYWLIALAGFLLLPFSIISMISRD